MYLLYSLLFVMVLAALALLAVPFVTNKTFFSKRFIIASLFILCFSFGVYQLSGNKIGLKFWLTQGKERYRLLSQFDELGGIDGAIKRVQEKLISNPNDAQGWFILAKLYEAKPDKIAAKKALAKAYQLDPTNEQIHLYYLSH